MFKIFIFIFLLLNITLFADKVNWIKTFPEAMQKSKENTKPIFFVLSNHKNDIVKEIEKDKEAVAFLNKNYVSFLSYKDKSDFIPRSILNPSVPSMWFLAQNGNLMYRQQSYDGHVYVSSLLRALIMVDSDMKRAIEKMRLSKIPYTLEVPFKYHIDMQSAQKASKASKKPIFMLIGRNSCKYCVKLKKEVLVDKAILKELEKEFVVLVHDANKPVDYRYNTPGIPAVWLLKENGEPLIRPLVGFVPKEKLTQAMSNAKLEFNKVKERIQ